MQSIVTKVAMQGALVGSVSLSSYVFRHFMWRNGSNTLFEETTYLKNEPNLCISLTELKKLGNEGMFWAIVGELELMLKTLNEDKSQAMPWIVNRMIHDIMLHSKQLCDSAKRSKDLDVLTACVDCVADHIPAIESCLEDVLHNLLLQ